MLSSAVDAATTSGFNNRSAKDLVVWLGEHFGRTGGPVQTSEFGPLLHFLAFLNGDALGLSTEDCILLSKTASLLPVKSVLRVQSLIWLL